MALSIVLSNSSGAPIYEQIGRQIKDAILTGKIQANEALPSIRVLARDLRVSVITTTRAYAELVNEGFVANVPGKGYYVLPRDRALMREQILLEVEQHLGQAVARAQLAEIDTAELHAMLDILIDTPGEDS